MYEMEESIKKQTTELLDIMGDPGMWMERLDILHEELQKQIKGLACISEVKDEKVRESLSRLYAYVKTRCEISTIQNIMQGVNDIAKMADEDKIIQQQTEDMKSAIDTLQHRVAELSNLICAVNSMLNNN